MRTPHAIPRGLSTRADAHEATITAARHRHAPGRGVLRPSRFAAARPTGAVPSLRPRGPRGQVHVRGVGYASSLRSIRRAPLSPAHPRAEARGGGKRQERPRRYAIQNHKERPSPRSSAIIAHASRPSARASDRGPHGQVHVRGVNVRALTRARSSNNSGGWARNKSNSNDNSKSSKGRAPRGLCVRSPRAGYRLPWVGGAPTL